MATQQIRKTFTYTAVFELQPEGLYTVTFPALRGCVTQGDTLQEAREMAKDAITCHIESMIKEGEELPSDKPARSSQNAK